MDGEELVLALRKLAPGLPVVIASGFGDAEVGARLVREELGGMISKPYNTEQLRAVLRQALEPGAGP